MQPVQVADILTYRFLSAVEISPDGRRAAFVVKRADPEKNAYRSDIHLVDLGSRATTQLTCSGKDGPFAWGADGSELFFLSKREEEEGKSFLYRIRVDGGEAERVAILPHKADGLRCLDGGRFPYTARIALPAEPDATSIDRISRFCPRPYGVMSVPVATSVPSLRKRTSSS